MSSTDAYHADRATKDAPAGPSRGMNRVDYIGPIARLVAIFAVLASMAAAGAVREPFFPSVLIGMVLTGGVWLLRPWGDVADDIRRAGRDWSMQTWAFMACTLGPAYFLLSAACYGAGYLAGRFWEMAL